MTHCLNTLANLIQQYIWLAPVLALLGGLVTSFTPCSLSSVPMVIAYIGGSAKNDTKKAFRLSLTMAGGLALTFLIFGSLASVLGHYLHEIETLFKQRTFIKHSGFAQIIQQIVIDIFLFTQGE